MKFLAPAKINLHLKVLNKRPDGYHNIRTILQTVSLYDEIYISKGSSQQATSQGRPSFGSHPIRCKSKIEFECLPVVTETREASELGNWIEFECLPVVTERPEENLAYRAAILIMEYFKKVSGTTLYRYTLRGDKFARTHRIKIEIKKNIPAGSGLGGGSSDAACVLKALPKFLHCNVDTKTLHKLAIKLGADVPYFLYGGLCLAEGVGDKITQLKSFWGRHPAWVVLINPGFSISTKDSYEQYDKKELAAKVNTHTICHCEAQSAEAISLRRMSLRATERSVAIPLREDEIATGLRPSQRLRRIAPPVFNTGSLAMTKDGIATKLSAPSQLFVNDLEQLVFRQYPQLEEIKSQLLSSGAITALMSGSGPTIFGIFQKKSQAELAIEKFTKLKKANYNVWLVKTI